MKLEECAALTLTSFALERPERAIGQAESLAWLAQAHAAAEATLRGLDMEATRAFEERLRSVLERCACGPGKIARRGHVTSDVGRTDWGDLPIYDVSRHPRGKTTAARAAIFDEIVSAYFERAYLAEQEPPGDLIHVTCTGYCSPSGAQKMVAARGWGSRTRVTHAYQMGCYAALPALRLAAGCLQLSPALASSAPARVDIVHTELCSLHLDPSQHSIEQLVVQSLFADGFIRYSLCADESARGLRVLSLSELILSDSANSMSWNLSDAGMQMTLARDVPERIASSLRPFVSELYQRAGLHPLAHLKETLFAVHPGGPRILDEICRLLELDEAQIAASRRVLSEFGNMSSATLPHVWSSLVSDDAVPRGTLVLALAFGPGLTVCGGLLRKQ